MIHSLKVWQVVVLSGVLGLLASLPFVMLYQYQESKSRRRPGKKSTEVKPRPPQVEPSPILGQNQLNISEPTIDFNMDKYLK